MARRNAYWEELFRLYYRPLCLYASRLVDSIHDVEDIVQSSFLSLLEHCSDAQEPQQVRAYLYRIVHNRCIDHLRTSSKLSSLPDGLANELPQEEDVDRSLVWAHLWEEIDRLPRKRRQVLLLSKRDGLSHIEIAKRMGISKRTVHNHLSKAISTLQKGKNK